MRFAGTPVRTLIKPILPVVIASQMTLGAWIASPQLSQAAQAVSEVAPVLGQYLRLKAEGKL